MQQATPPLTHRPATEQDRELIFSILCEAMRDCIVKTWGKWDEEDQRRRYNESTRIEDHCILELNGEPAGCLCVKISDEEVYLARLSLFPKFQNRGLGTKILREFIETADHKHLPVRLRVLRVNPARRLYERHGFKIVEQNETHYTMVREAR